MSDLPPLLLPLLLGLMPLIEEIGLLPRTTDCVELFCGKKAITNAAVCEGLEAIGYDKIYSRSGRPQDINSKAGFMEATKNVLSLKPDGSLWAAVECKTWIFISRYGTGRSQWNPAGNSKIPRIGNANKMAVAVTTLLVLAWYIDVHVFVEQPTSSLLRHFEPFATFARFYLKHSARTYLGMFGAPTPKPIDVLASTAEVSQLARSQPRGLESLTSKNKDGSHTGKRMRMSQSSAYPPKFGVAVVRVYKHLLKKPTVKRAFPSLHERFLR